MKYGCHCPRYCPNPNNLPPAISCCSGSHSEKSGGGLQAARRLPRTELMAIGIMGHSCPAQAIAVHCDRRQETDNRGRAKNSVDRRTRSTSHLHSLSWAEPSHWHGFEAASNEQRERPCDGSFIFACAALRGAYRGDFEHLKLRSDKRAGVCEGVYIRSRLNGCEPFQPANR
jgi:hypothetical protein